jgi:hypothetical protein
MRQAHVGVMRIRGEPEAMGNADWHFARQVGAPNVSCAVGRQEWGACLDEDGRAPPDIGSTPQLEHSMWRTASRA